MRYFESATCWAIPRNKDFLRTYEYRRDAFLALGFTIRQAMALSAGVLFYEKTT